MAGKASGRARTHAAGKRRNGTGSPAQKAADPCGASRRCGACQHIAEPYGLQLKRKLAYVEYLYVSAGIVQPGALCELPAAFSPSGFSDGGAWSMDAAGTKESVAFSPVLGMADPRFYRNKVISPFARGRRLADGKRGARYAIECGMYAAHSHKIIDTSGCLIENQQAKQVISEIKRLMGKFGIEPYDEDAGEGFMRHAVVRVGHESGEVLVTLVTNSGAFPASKSFCRELVRRCPFVTSVVQNVNTRQTNVILGEEEHRLYGPGFILDTLCGLSFRVSPHSFYQVNSTQTEVLYNTAIALAGLNGAQDVIDAYCGTGTIGLVAASRGARSVVGVDTVESAIRDARENARHNGIENARFVAGDASAFMRGLAARGGSRCGSAGCVHGPAACGFNGRISRCVSETCARLRSIHIMQPRNAGARCRLPATLRLPSAHGGAGGHVPPYRPYRSGRFARAQLAWGRARGAEARGNRAGQASYCAIFGSRRFAVSSSTSMR